MKMQWKMGYAPEMGYAYFQNTNLVYINSKEGKLRKETNTGEIFFLLVCFKIWMYR